MHWVSGFAGLQLLLGTGFLAYPLALVYGIHTFGERLPRKWLFFGLIFFCLQNGIDFEFYALYT